MSEIVAEGIVPADALQQFVDTFLPTVSEAKLHFDDDGLHASAVDPANVAMTMADLGTGAFESYDAPGRVTIGLGLEVFDERLGVASSGELVQFEIDMETRHLELEIGNVSHSVTLIDPDTIRQEPDMPELDLPNEVTVEGERIARVAEIADMVSDHALIQAEPEERRVVWVAEGDTDDSEIVWGRDETIDADVARDDDSMFSVDYLDDLSGPIPDDAEVRIRFGDEFPIRWWYEAVEGELEVEQACAPRIQAE